MIATFQSSYISLDFLSKFQTFVLVPHPSLSYTSIARFLFDHILLLCLTLKFSSCLQLHRFYCRSSQSFSYNFFFSFHTVCPPVISLIIQVFSPYPLNHLNIFILDSPKFSLFSLNYKYKFVGGYHLR